MKISFSIKLETCRSTDDKTALESKPKKRRLLLKYPVLKRQIQIECKFETTTTRSTVLLRSLDRTACEIWETYISNGTCKLPTFSHHSLINIKVFTFKHCLLQWNLEQLWSSKLHVITEHRPSTTASFFLRSITNLWERTWK